MEFNNTCAKSDLLENKLKVVQEENLEIEWDLFFFGRERKENCSRMPEFPQTFGRDYNKLALSFIPHS